MDDLSFCNCEGKTYTLESSAIFMGGRWELWQCSKCNEVRAVNKHWGSLDFVDFFDFMITVAGEIRFVTIENKEME